MEKANLKRPREMEFLMPGANMMEGSYDGDEDGDFDEDPFPMPHGAHATAHDDTLLAGSSDVQRSAAHGFLAGSFDLGLRESTDPLAMSLKREPVLSGQGEALPLGASMQPPPTLDPGYLQRSEAPPAIASGDLGDWEKDLAALGDGADLDASKRFNGGQPLTSLDKLTGNQYLYLLRQMETKLKGIRQRIVQRDLAQLDVQLGQLRFQLEQYAEEFEALKSGHFLRPGDFNNLLSLEEFLQTTLLQQLALYELDYQQLTNPEASTGDVAVHLAIVSQGNAGPIFKEKQVGPFTLRLLTGATITQIQSGPVQPEIYETSQRIKRNNQDLENSKQIFKENGTATFSDLKFSSGTFPNLVRIKFHVKIQLVINGQRITRTIESAPTKPYVSMTNTGSQWKDAAGSWFKEECFREAFEITTARLWNYFQKHYLNATKQELGNIKRPLFLQDFDYLLRAKFKLGTDKPTINQKEFQKFWDWIGPALKKIRYQKYLLWLFENGYLACFVTGQEAEEQLANEPPGTFIIRLSERLDGEFVISYTHQSGIRHYLMQPDDTTDKKKTLIDFLGQNPLFIYVLQLTTQPNGKRVYYKHSKDKVLQKYYKKSPKQVTKAPNPGGQNPYDTRLPLGDF